MADLPLRGAGPPFAAEFTGRITGERPGKFNHNQSAETQAKVGADDAITLFVKKPLRGMLIASIWSAPVRKVTPLTIVFACVLAASVNAASPTFAPVRALPKSATPTPASEKSFVLKDASGQAISVPLVGKQEQLKLAKVDSRLNPSLARAATIAQDRAYAHSKSRCWRYVKQALVAAGAVSSYPKTALAKQAGDELVRDYGFKKLAVQDPYAAPVGAVLVYGGKGAGHVEIRNKTGFVSDFRAAKPSKRQLIGVYAKA